jgi:hypothetical protein
MSDQRVDQDAKRQSVRLDRSDSNLDAALGFVIDRIAEQGEVSGEPLGVEQCPLLNYPPSRTPQTWDPEFFVLVPRNVNLERVCALAKVAHRHDRQMNPALLDWEFAFAVFAFTGHPMAGLLQLAGVKPRRPRWDRLLLIVTALMPLVAAVLIGWNTSESVLPSAATGSGGVAIDVLRFEAHRKTPIGKGNREIATCVSLCLARRQTHMSARFQIWLDAYG